MFKSNFIFIVVFMVRLFVLGIGFVYLVYNLGVIFWNICLGLVFRYSNVIWFLNKLKF